MSAAAGGSPTARESAPSDHAPPRAGAAAGALLVAGREIGALLDAGIAFVVAAGFALLSSSAFMNEFFLSGRVDMSPYFDRLPYLFILFLPAVSMRQWSEERRARTFEVLASLPLTLAQLVAGKFLAALFLFAVLLATSLPIVVMLAALGDPDPGRIAGGYLAAAFSGALLLALGLLCSSLTRDQVTAFVLSVLGAALLVLSGHERLVVVLDGLAPGLRPGSWLREHLSLLPHYERLARGVLDLPALVYFAGATLLFLWANALVLRRARD